jgi:3-phosphoshikimate 1-carboxyvinyltransferase
MVEYVCQPVPGPIDAVVRVPGSKSITNRALIAAALADGHSLLTDALLADDTRLMIDALRALGIAVTVDEGGPNLEVTGCGGHLPLSEARLFCGNAGTVMRFGAAMAATAYGSFELDGVERMRERPIGDLADALRSLGSGVEYLGEEGFPPIRLHARRLRGGQISLKAPPSSQFISALLLAAPCAADDVLIEVAGPVPSVPYLKMTVAVMERFGVSVVEQYAADAVRYIVPAPQRYAGCAFAVEPDASNATYFLAAPAVAGGRVVLEGLGEGSVQGDARFVDVLERMGCSIVREPNRLTVSGPAAGDRLRGIALDLNDMPDTVQTLAVIALFAAGPTTIRNVANLRVKETDRIAALATELAKLGAVVEQRPDGLTVHPPRTVTPAVLDTYDDHRMAMSLALAGLRCPGTVIRNPGCCAKTFPDFFERWDRLSGRAN